MKLAIIGLSIAVALASANPALANRAPVTLTPGSAIVTPLHMQYFCRQNPLECRATKDASVKLTDEMLKTLQKVNVAVNNAIRPQANPPGGWKINPRSGDCNDYVLSKRSQLIKMGVPAGALRFAVTKTRRGESHAVLLVKTSAGEIVLDNLNNQVKTLQQSGYSIRMMAGANPLRWVAG